MYSRSPAPTWRIKVKSIYYRLFWFSWFTLFTFYTNTHNIHSSSWFVFIFVMVQSDASSMVGMVTVCPSILLSKLYQCLAWFVTLWLIHWSIDWQVSWHGIPASFYTFSFCSFIDACFWYPYISGLLWFHYVCLRIFLTGRNTEVHLNLGCQFIMFSGIILKRTKYESNCSPRLCVKKSSSSLKYNL